MDIRQLTYFLAVADAGTVTAAAQRLHLSQPPLSIQLRQLEEELGCRLFDRDSRHMQLTDAGRLLYDRATEILFLCSSAQNALSDWKAGAAGTLRLGVATSVAGTLLPPLLNSFHFKYPLVHMELYEGDTFRLLERIHDGRIEIALVRQPFSAAGLSVLHLQSEPFLAVGLPGFFQRSDSPLPLSALSSAPLLLYRRWEQSVRDCFAQDGLSAGVLCVGDDARTAIALAEAGLGVAVVPRSALPADSRLVSRLLSFDALSSEICAVCREGQYVSAVANNFLEEAKVLRQPKCAAL